EPLLGISRRFATAIYAWELMNEPEWVTSGSGCGETQDHMVGSANMLAFLGEGVQLINDRGFRSTVGFAHYRTMQRLSRTIGATLHQFHYYAGEQGPFSRLSPLAGSPTFVGEFATAVDTPWPGLVTQDAECRLRSIESNGFEAGF